MIVTQTLRRTVVQEDLVTVLLRNTSADSMSFTFQSGESHISLFVGVQILWPNTSSISVGKSNPIP